MNVKRMNVKRIVGIVVLVLGIIFIGFSSYIKHEVNIGKGQVASAQGKVDSANSLFSKSPATKKAGKMLTSPIQKQINEGKVDIRTYQAISNWLMAGGIIFILGGAGVIYMSCCGKCK